MTDALVSREAEIAQLRMGARVDAKAEPNLRSEIRRLHAENADLRATLDNVRKMYVAAERREAALANRLEALIADAPVVERGQ